MSEVHTWHKKKNFTNEEKNRKTEQSLYPDLTEI